MAKSTTSGINRKIEKILNYPGCGEIELNSRKTLWFSSFFGFLHVLILTFSFLFFVPELTILIKYGFTCLVILTVTLIVIPFLKKTFNSYITIHLLVILLVTFYTIYLLGGIVTSAGLIVACLSFVLLSIPLQQISVTIFMFVVYSVFIVFIGFVGPNLAIPEQITPLRNSIIWMINTLSMSALALLFVVDFITQRQKYEQLEAAKQKELSDAKTKLFTNITHEFRTPLTIILGMTDLIVNKPETWLLDGAEKIKNNSNILLRLVNQMLDISKIETGMMTLQMIQGDINTFIRYVTELFHSVADNKKIEINFSTDRIPVIIDFDPDKMVTIVSNLISNALKFTPENGRIEIKTTLNEKEKTFTLIVNDTGTGINSDQLSHIFDRFYQVENIAGGTGLGLALTKEITELLKGEISVESQPGFGTAFKIVLPVSRTAELDDNVNNRILSFPIVSGTGDNKHRILPNSDEKANNESMHTLLIVEDSFDVSQYLCEILKNEYHVEKAENGKTGLEKALKIIPDIILSDVMMPEMDGIEMLEKIKNDFRTSHIPVVLLTAKADIDSRLIGLAHGADAYIAKPFNENELHIQLKNLIELRKTLHERYKTFAKYPETNDLAIKTEDSFMIKVREKLEKNIANEDYDINNLCRELAVSHAQLYRKFKSISNQTIADYFKLLRLHRAKELLLKQELNITQVAFAVGFKNLSHFSREFTQQFGKSPKEIRKL